jgi:hypothetical protein
MKLCLTVTINCRITTTTTITTTTNGFTALCWALSAFSVFNLIHSW